MTAVNLARLVRHQGAAALATLVDFGAMVLLVEFFRASPPIATMLSACLGACANFTLSRSWAFRALHTGSRAAQALRYAGVAAGGAALNAALLALALRAFVQTFAWEGNAPYVGLRAFAAILVSVIYTYPMHVRVVFRLREVRA